MLNDCDLFIDDLWRDLAGMPVRVEHAYPLELLRTTQWNVDFEKRMRDELVIGALRYGPIRGSIADAPPKPNYDRTSAIASRIGEYVETGDVSLLVGIANLAMLEYTEGTHPLRHNGGASEPRSGRVGIR